MTEKMFSKTHRYTYQPPLYGMVHKLSFASVQMDVLTEDFMDYLLIQNQDLNYLWKDDRKMILEIWANDLKTIRYLCSVLKKM